MLNRRNTKKTYLTKHEKSQTIKKEFYEAAEKIFETGHENRKRSVKAILEIEKEKEKAKQDKIAISLEKATKQRRFDDHSYLTAVREAAVEGIEQIDYSDYPGWNLKLYITTGDLIEVGGRPFKTEKGLLAILTSPSKNYYHLGMRASFDPVNDVLGARSMAVLIEDSLDHYSGQSEEMKDKKEKLWTPKNNSLQGSKLN